MEITEKTRLQFGKQDNFLFNLFKVPNSQLFLNGSYGKTNYSLYSGAIDFYVRMNPEDIEAFASKGPVDLILKVQKQYPKVGLYQIKLGTINFTPEQALKMSVKKRMKQLNKLPLINLIVGE